MTDMNLQASVTEELVRELRVDSGDIAVSADGSVVTLRGTVGGQGQKRRAQNAAWRVGGVRGVSNQLLVRVADGASAGAALPAPGTTPLVLDDMIPRQREGSDQ